MNTPHAAPTREQCIAWLNARWPLTAHEREMQQAILAHLRSASAAPVDGVTNPVRLDCAHGQRLWQRCQECERIGYVVHASSPTPAVAEASAGGASDSPEWSPKWFGGNWNAAQPPAREASATGEPSNEACAKWCDDGLRHGLMHFDDGATFHYLTVIAKRLRADIRKCTCHPDDNPPKPCPRKYALTDCRAAAAAALRPASGVTIGEDAATALDAGATALEERGEFHIYKNGKLYTRAQCVAMARELRRLARLSTATEERG